MIVIFLRRLHHVLSLFLSDHRIYLWHQLFRLQSSWMHFSSTEPIFVRQRAYKLRRLNFSHLGDHSFSMKWISTTLNPSKIFVCLYGGFWFDSISRKTKHLYLKKRNEGSILRYPTQQKTKNTYGPTSIQNWVSYLTRFLSTCVPLIALKPKNAFTEPSLTTISLQQVEDDAPLLFKMSNQPSKLISRNNYKISNVRTYSDSSFSTIIHHTHRCENAVSAQVAELWNLCQMLLFLYVF